MFPPSAAAPTTAVALLGTIAELENRLAVARQQLAYELQQLQVVAPSAGFIPSSPPGFIPRGQGRTPYFPSPSPSPSSSASIRLQSHSSPMPFSRKQQYPQQQQQQQQQQPYVQQKRKPEDLISVPLSAVLQDSEEVSFRIIIQKDEAGQPIYSVLVATFDGEKLVVSQCVHVPSLVGVASVKPGEILYRFMEGLKDAGHLKRSFTVAPWRLCSVAREGQEETLEELRRKFLQSQGARPGQSQSA